MSEPPFHVAGGFFAPTSAFQPDALLPQAPAMPEDTVNKPPQGSRRRKLWGIPHKFDGEHSFKKKTFDR